MAAVRRALWGAADELRANSKLTAAQYRQPVLGQIFLAYAEHRSVTIRPELEAKATARNPVTPQDYKARSVLYVPEVAQLSGLVALPEGDDLGKAIDGAMDAIENANPELKGILPRGYQRLDRSTLIELVRLFAPLPTQLDGDAFGLIYEDFLSNFASQEGRLGGEFFTPYSIVRLIVEVIEPYHGRVLDPACGSGGMFVQCAKFVERHNKSATRELSIFGAEKTEETVPLAKMNLALHGLTGDIREANTYYEDPHKVVGSFDFVMANLSPSPCSASAATAPTSPAAHRDPRIGQESLIYVSKSLSAMRYGHRPSRVRLALSPHGIPNLWAPASCARL